MAQAKELIEKKKVDVNDSNYSEKIFYQYDLLYTDTPLTLAIFNGKYEVANMLVENGAKRFPNIQEAVEPFYAVACRHADYTALKDRKDKGKEDDYIKFDWYHKEGDLDKMEKLMDTMLKHGYDVMESQEYRTEGGFTLAKQDPLYVAACAGDKRLAVFLLERGAKVNHQDAIYDRAMYRSTLGGASANGNLEMVKFLYDHGAKVEPDKLSHQELSPLAQAVANKHEDVADFLIANGADVNRVSDRDEWTALMCAARNGDVKMAKKLLEHGADATLRSLEHGDAAQIACTNGHEELGNMLEAIATKQEEEKRTVKNEKVQSISSVHVVQQGGR